MSLASILDEPPLLSPGDLHALRERIDDLDTEGWQDDLSADEQKLILERVEKGRQHPEFLVPWEVAGEQMRSKNGAW
jgi:hypothetical protein